MFWCTNQPMETKIIRAAANAIFTTDFLLSVCIPNLLKVLICPDQRYASRQVNWLSRTGMCRRYGFRRKSSRSCSRILNNLMLLLPKEGSHIPKALSLFAGWAR
jgi:hypothetical protein